MLVSNRAPHLLAAVTALHSSAQHSLMTHIKAFQKAFHLDLPSHTLPHHSPPPPHDILLPHTALSARYSSSLPISSCIEEEKSRSSSATIHVSVENSHLHSSLHYMSQSIAKLRTLNSELKQRNCELEEALRCSFEDSLEHHSDFYPQKPTTHLRHNEDPQFISDCLTPTFSSRLYNDLQDKLLHQQSIIDCLKEDLQHMLRIQRENESLRTTIDILDSQLCEMNLLRDRCDTLSEKHATTTKDLEKQTRSFHHLKMSHDKLSERFHQLLQENFTTKCKLDEANQEIERARNEHCKRENQFSLLMKQHEQTLSALEDGKVSLKYQSEQCDCLLEEVMDLRQKMEKLSQQLMVDREASPALTEHDTEKPSQSTPTGLESICEPNISPTNEEEQEIVGVAKTSGGNSAAKEGYVLEQGWASFEGCRTPRSNGPVLDKVSPPQVSLFEEEEDPHGRQKEKMWQYVDSLLEEMEDL